MTARQELVTCGICATQAYFVAADVTDGVGAPGLDFRPAEPARSAMLGWVQRCASCGYCARRIDEAPDDLADVIATAPYRSQLAEDGMPELARSFLCVAYLAEWYGDEAEAARCAVQAAWVCDDADEPEHARRCRLRAVELVDECHAEGDAVFQDGFADYALLVDLHRRAGRFEDAVRQAEIELDGAEEYLVEMLSFARALALAGDPDAHTIDDLSASGPDDRAIVAALRQLETCRRRKEYAERFVILHVNERRNYYVQFAVDEGGLYCEVVHNRYLASENQFSGDDIATLLALGFEAPEDETRNLFRVFQPSCGADLEAIVALVRTIVTDFFGLPATHALQMVCEFGEPARW
jgi:hypothetical protein